MGVISVKLAVPQVLRDYVERGMVPYAEKMTFRFSRGTETTVYHSLPPFHMESPVTVADVIRRTIQSLIRYE